MSKSKQRKVSKPEGSSDALELPSPLQPNGLPQGIREATPEEWMEFVSGRRPVVEREPRVVVFAYPLVEKP